MKKLVALLALASLTACSMIPSRWDPNESRSITDLQFTTRHFDCSGSVLAQATLLQQQVEWFDIYTGTKGTADMRDLTKTLDETVKELVDRSSKGPVSPMYCDLKKKVLIQQADIIGKAVQGRF
jgi:hypothetical protein